MRLPILYHYSQLFIGAGFLARVEMRGRALFELDEDGAALTGVAPAGWCGVGGDRQSAFEDFRRGWADVVTDIAKSALDFALFKSEVERLCAVRAATFSADWDEALRQVREGPTTDDGLERVPADEWPDRCEVLELDSSSLQPLANANDGPSAVAA